MNHLAASSEELTLPTRLTALARRAGSLKTVFGGLKNLNTFIFA